MFERIGTIKIRYSVLVPWVASYVLIMLIPLVFSVIVYLKTVNIIRLDITETNAATLKQIQQTLDGHLREIEELSIRINSNAKVRTLMDVFSGDYRHESRHETVKNVLDMNSELSTYALANGYIKEFSLFFVEGDFVWSAYSIFDKKSFFEKSIFSQETSYSEWLSRMNVKYVNHYSGKSDGGITFLQSLPIGSLKAKANLLVTLDVNKIRELITNAGWYENNIIYILDQDDRILFSSSITADGPVPIIHYADMSDNYGIHEAKTKTGKYVISYISSQRAQWKYVCFVPFAVFSEKAVYVKYLTLIGLLFCALIESLIALYFLKKNYHPLNHVITYLKAITGFLNKNKNEFGFIEDSIAHVFQEKERIGLELLRQNAALRGNIILKLLKGRYGAHYPDVESLNTYGISFRSDFFVVALFYLDEYAESETAENEESDEEKLKLFQNILAEAMSNIFGEKYLSFVVEADDIIAAVINFIIKPATNWKSESEERFKKLEVFFQEKHRLTCTMAVSAVHETAKGINLAYREALDALEYQLFDWSSRVLFYEDVKEAKNKSLNYSYTGETEQKLINSIISGNFELSRTILDEVFHENFTSGRSGVQLAKCLMIDLVSTYLKALNSRGLLEETQILGDKISIQELYECRTLEEIKQKLCEFLGLVCSYTLEYKEKHGEGRVIKKIISLVESNFSNANLNIASLADLMKMNPKYISSVYRAETGDSIITLINKTRIRFAKELLKSDLNISDVALAVGYGNSNAFIRIYKKYEGITPGRFRELK